MYLVFVNEFPRASALLVVALLITGLLHTGVALGQVANGGALGLTWLGELDQGALGYLAIGSPRAYGLGFNPNSVAFLMALASLLGYGWFLIGESRWPWKAVVAGSSLINFLGLAATASRSAFLGWLLGLLAVTLLAWLWRRQARGLVLRLAGIAVLAFTLTTIVALSVVPAAGDSQGPFSNAFSNAGKGLDRFSSSQITTGLEGRGQDLAYSLSIIREALFLGVGAGNYPQELKQNLDPGSLGGIYTPVHNVPLLILAELGILGGVAWALLMLAPLIWIISRRKEPPADLRSLLWVGPLLVLLFEGLWDFPPWSTQDGRVLMMAVLGLWVGGLDSEGIDLKTRVGRFWGGGFQPFLSLSARRMLRSQISSSMPLKRAGQFLRRNRAELGVVFLFLVLALAVTYPLVFQLSSHIAGCCDAWQSYWYIWWTKEFFSLEGGINPLFTDFIFYPTGTSLSFESMYNRLLGSLLWPIFGGVATYNLLYLSTYVLSAFGAYLLVLHLTGNRKAGVVAGVVYGFSVVHVLHIQHLNVITIQWLPFLVLWLLKALDAPTVKNAVICAVFYLLVLLSSGYYAVAGAILLALVLLWEGKLVFTRKFLKFLIVFSVSSIILSLPFVWVHRTEAISGDEFVSISGVSRYFSADVVPFVTPPRAHPIFGEYVTPVYSKLLTHFTEWEAYLGLLPVVLAILGVFAGKARRLSSGL